MKIHLNKLLINSLILMMSLLLCAKGQAENWQDEANVESEYFALVQENNQQPYMDWTLLPGESLNDVARLFYPKNKLMQWRFVEKTVQLSRDVYPNLNPTYHADVERAIIIPNIKYLKAPKVKKAFKSEPKKLIKAPDVSSEEVLNKTSAWQEAYEYLVAKNQFLKQEIAKLNAKLEHLQEVLAKLTVDLMRMLEQSLPQSGANNTQTIESAATTALSPASATNNGLGRGPKDTWYLWLPILSVLFVMSLFFMMGLHKTNSTVNNYPKPDFYSKLKSKYGRISKNWLTKDKPKPIKKSPVIFSADFPIQPVAKSEYSGSMIVTDLSDIGIPNSIDDKELALEQAQIYVDIQREDVAIKLLRDQIKSAPKAALRHWLLLLDIYRKNNQKEEFMQYAKLLHKHFNVMMPTWENNTLPAAIATSLEQFEHISNKMTALWESCEKEAAKISQTKEYLDQLLVDNRSNERAGFSLEVFKEIMLLRGMLDMRQKLAVND